MGRFFDDSFMYGLGCFSDEVLKTIEKRMSELVNDGNGTEAVQYKERWEDGKLVGSEKRTWKNGKLVETLSDGKFIGDGKCKCGEDRKCEDGCKCEKGCKCEEKCTCGDKKQDFHEEQHSEKPAKMEELEWKYVAKLMEIEKEVGKLTDSIKELKRCNTKLMDENTLLRNRNKELEEKVSAIKKLF